MDTSLTGRRALVCGSTQGIGRACAVELALLGASVVLLARDEGRLNDARAALPASGPQRHETLVADLADPDAARRAVESEIVSRGPVHVVINNTGGPPPGAAIDATPEDLLAAFRAQLLTAQAIAQAAVPGMKDARFGRIINITSTSVKAPIAGLGISNIVRAAVANWAKSLSIELGPHGITVNNILPGFTATERLTSLKASRAKARGVPESQIEAEWIASIPAGRLGRPEEVAAAAAFLATPAAAYVNGINLPVDGGRLPTL